MQPTRRTSLLFMLVSFTVLFVFAQLTLFLVHYNISSLVDSILSSSIVPVLLNTSILYPLFAYLAIQVFAYIVFTAWIYSLATTLGKQYHLSYQLTYYLGIGIWMLAVCALLSLNTHYYPHSFFAVLPGQLALIISTGLCMTLTMLTVMHSIIRRRAYLSAGILIIAVLSIVYWNKTAFVDQIPKARAQTNKPNVIVIGLDSLRPDVVNATDTPAIYQFLQSSHTFTNAYTPLARTYPAWMTLLTGLHPKHSGARANMVDPTNILKLDNLARKLKSAGYFTVYGTDLPRFTDIDERYGFDRVMQPKSGLAEFMLADLYDFPLGNLLLRVPGARQLFPYNYGNRTAAITYDPDQFLDQVQASLNNRPNQPLFLALHLCIAHWPHTFARDGESDAAFLDQGYHTTVQALDTQFAALLTLLSRQGLLDSSVIVLMSDHGVTLGQPHDRSISKENYIGNPNILPRISHFKLDHTPEVTLDFQKDYSIATSYGMGTDILSLKQNHIVLAFKSTSPAIKAMHDEGMISLADLAPTLLNYLNLPPLKNIDGHSYNLGTVNRISTAIFFETGDRFSSIEKSNISVAHVVKEAIGSYDINPRTGLLTIKNDLLSSLLQNKQRAILKDGWLLARFPQSRGYIRKNPDNLFGLTPAIIKPYYVLLNTKTGQWTMDLSNPFARKVAPSLLLQLNQFYDNELTTT